MAFAEVAIAVTFPEPSTVIASSLYCSAAVIPEPLAVKPVIESIPSSVAFKLSRLNLVASSVETPTLALLVATSDLIVSRSVAEVTVMWSAFCLTATKETSFAALVAPSPLMPTGLTEVEPLPPPTGLPILPNLSPGTVLSSSGPMVLSVSSKSRLMS